MVGDDRGPGASCRMIFRFCVVCVWGFGSGHVFCCWFRFWFWRWFWRLVLVSVLVLMLVLVLVVALMFWFWICWFWFWFLFGCALVDYF